MSYISMKERQRSGARRIFEALSGVDEALLIKCEDAGPAKKVASVLVAAVCVAAVGIVLWSETPKFAGKDMASTEKADLVENMAQDAAEAAPQEPEMAVTASSSADLTEESKPEAAEGCLDYKYADVTGQGNNGAAQESLKDSEGGQGTDGVTPESIKQGSSQSGAVNTEDVKISEMTGELVVDKEISGSAPKDTRIDITLAEARGISILGEYVPDKLPGGYVWESGEATENKDTGIVESIALCWVNGMDSIQIFISKADADSVTLADVDAPETYDVHLYEIPYAETVPEKYREVFNNPVFRGEDLSLDIVKARMKSVADAGDTSTPRGTFEVLYEDGVLVRFSGRGSAEEIWEMFASIQ